MRRYSNNAAQTTLSAAATAAQTSISVTAVTGFPSVEFVLALDYGTSNQELVLVTAVSGTSLTVTRGYDNTTALSHAVGAGVVHTHSAADFADSRNHEAATSGVHGLAGTVVGTSDTQVLTHKDLSDPTNTFPSALATDAEVSTAVSNHAAATTGVHGVGTGSVVGTTEAQTLTNKNLADPSNTFPVVSQKGTATIAGAAATILQVVVDLDPSIFNGAAPSNVQLTPRDSWSDVAHCFTSSRTANQFTLKARHIDNVNFSPTTTVTVDWVAWV